MFEKENPKKIVLIGIITYLFILGIFFLIGQIFFNEAQERSLKTKIAIEKCNDLNGSGTPMGPPGDWYVNCKIKNNPDVNIIVLEQKI